MALLVALEFSLDNLDDEALVTRLLSTFGADLDFGALLFHSLHFLLEGNCESFLALFAVLFSTLGTD